MWRCSLLLLLPWLGLAGLGWAGQPWEGQALATLLSVRGGWFCSWGPLTPPFSLTHSPTLPPSRPPTLPPALQVKTRQMTEDNPYLGVDCNDVGTHDMRQQNVFETLSGKKQQLMLATQVCKMILKIDDVIMPSAYE